MATQMTDEETLTAYGATYHNPGESVLHRNRLEDTYAYHLYHGHHTFDLRPGDCVFMLTNDKQHVVRYRGARYNINSMHFACIIRGYAPDDVMRTLQTGMTLPYVNGCSTKQLVPAERDGDPTIQQLTIPPFSREQAHHIHSTVRVVHILSGRGVSLVGMEKRYVKTELLPGMSCVLDPMCPHHFETPYGEPLVVLPVHVFSSGS